MYISQEYKVIFFHTPKTAGRSLARAFGFFEGTDKRLHHFTTKDAKEMIFQDTWNQYWKFAFVRNPWERYVSLYEFHKQSEYIAQYNSMSSKNARCHRFKDWMYLNKHGYIYSSWWGLPQTEWTNDCNCVLRFEELIEASQVMTRHLPLMSPLEKINASEHGDYRTYYDDETRKMVKDLERETIKRFGYKF